MLALVALGVLDHTSAFPRDDVSAELVRSVVKLQHSTVPLYGELIAPLAERGRGDLVWAVEHQIAKYHDRGAGFKARVRRFGRKYLNGGLRGLLSSMG
jgi:hypothetical protein